MTAHAANLRGYAREKRWLGLQNRYRRATVDRLKIDTDQGAQPKSKHLAEYLAASAPCHCLDGWAFLGRALSCHLVGDADTARHLAYYAEVRAAGALLATAGIGVFHNRHVVIGSDGKATRLSGKHRTHQMMWLALAKWASSSDAAMILGRNIRPEGRSIDEWLGQMTTGPGTWQPIGEEWLLTLGLDLQRLAVDREARNEASYRPTHLRRARGTVSAVQAARFGLEFWQLLEPSHHSFRLLDLHFLRLTLESAFRAVTGRSVRQSPSGFEDTVTRVVRGVLAEPVQQERVASFLLRRRQPDDSLIIADARRRTGLRDPRHHVSVISRAALLLRIATAATRNMFTDAGLSFEALSFWWQGIGVRRGLWEGFRSVDELVDLWADLVEELELVGQWAEVADEGASYHSFVLACAASLPKLGNTELPGLWGLAP